MYTSIFCALLLPLLARASFVDQEILLPPALANEPFRDPVFTPATTSKPTLADLLTIEPSASIYFSYARETELSKEFSIRENQLTLLVPTNKAIMGLARKPHQGAEPVESEMNMSEEEFDKRSRRNVERWVAAHILPVRISLADAPVTYDTLLDGKSVTFTPAPGKEDSPYWSKVILEDGIHIVDAREGRNGIIYMIDGVVQPN